MAYDFPANPPLGQTYTQGKTTYIWDGSAWMKGSSAASGVSDFVKKSGDVMTGFLTLSADPVDPMHAATRQYVENNAGGIPPAGDDGQALVARGGAPVWGAPIQGGNF